jgi:uncharacterized protein (DUF305 family)
MAPMRSGNLALRWAAIAPVALALLAGCGGSDKPPPREQTANVVQPGAPGEPSRKLSADETAAIESPKHTKADVDFMQAMIHHHWQAILMTRWVPRRSPGPDVPLMAKRMEISQEAEIEVMRKWLLDRGVKPNEPGDHSGHDHGTGKGLPPGMLTSRQLGRLYNTKGRAFDRLFLRYMTYHHNGALQMVRQLLEDGGGAEPELGAFTRHVEADQGIEIARMQDLLAELR